MITTVVGAPIFQYSLLIMDVIWASTTDLKKAAGSFDRLAVRPGHLVFEGWMFCPDVQFDSVSAYLNGICLGFAERFPRKDVQQAHPWINDLDSPGFKFEAKGECPLRSVNTVQLIGRDSSRPVAVLSTLDLAGPEDALGRCPPLELVRMVGSPDVLAYHQQGCRILADLLLAAGDFLNSGQPMRVLDWGCGCGRLTRHLLKIGESAQIFGCDVVPELVDWCQKVLPSGRFSLTGIMPPTGFKENFFDVVTGISVMTHLDRNRQLEWLREINRIMKPGGLLVASTLGEYAFCRHISRKRKLPWLHRSSDWQDKLQRLRQEGVLDSTPNRTLKRIVPPDYYRDVYQTEAFTCRHWGQHFSVTRYIPLGLGGFQDLVVLQSPQL